MVSGTQMPVSAILRASTELAKDLGVKKVAIIHSDEPYPAGEAEGGRELVKEAGMELVLLEKFPKGQKDFSTILQKVRASGAEALFPAAYEGDQISILRQMKQLNIHFPFVFMEYASTPQFAAAVGKDGAYIFSHTNYHPAINWAVTAGLNRQQFADAYKAKFPNAEFAPDYQTVLAYGAGVLTEEIIKKAGSTDAAALKKASLDLSDKVTVLAGPYAIDETGKQLKMPFPVLQAQTDGRLETVWPKDVATVKPVFPIPAWNKALILNGTGSAMEPVRPWSFMPDLTSATLSTLAAGLEAGTYSSRSLTEYYLDRIRRFDGALNAFASVDEVAALDLADAADRRRAAAYELGPLDGLPIAVKDLCDIKGRVTTAGSRVWSERRADATAPVVQRLIEAGMVVLGKTQMVEFAFGGWEPTRISARRSTRGI